MFLTIGHSNHKPEKVRDYLRERGVTHLIDVRSKPGSRFNPGFNRDIFHRTLANVGIEYVFKGDELGGYAPPDANMATAIDRMVRYFSQRPNSVPVLMCSEGKACDCHRHHWINRHLLANTSVSCVNIHPDKPDEDPAAVPFLDGFNDTPGMHWPLPRPFRIVPSAVVPRWVSDVGYATEEEAQKEVNSSCRAGASRVTITKLK